MVMIPPLLQSPQTPARGRGRGRVQRGRGVATRGHGAITRGRGTITRGRGAITRGRGAVTRGQGVTTRGRGGNRNTNIVVTDVKSRIGTARGRGTARGGLRYVGDLNHIGVSVCITAEGEEGVVEELVQEWDFNQSLVPELGFKWQGNPPYQTP